MTAMTATIAFDTHRYVKRLTGAGMPEPQAEVIADEQRALIEDQLATKRDLKELEAATRRDIKELEVAIKTLETNTRRDNEELKTELKRDIKELEVVIKTLEANTRRDNEELKAGLKRDIKEMEARLEHRLTLRLGAMILAGADIVTALVKLI